MNKRAQAALEFLTTYGWAILVILVMIGALVYFGLLNPSKALPNKCDAPPGFSCKDFQITEDGFTVIMLNKNGDSIKNVNITSDPVSDSFIAASVPASVCTIDGAASTIVPADAEFIVNCPLPDMFDTLGGKGQKVKIDFTLAYIPIRGTYVKTASTTIYGPVQLP